MEKWTWHGQRSRPTPFSLTWFYVLISQLFYFNLFYLFYFCLVICIWTLTTCILFSFIFIILKIKSCGLCEKCAASTVDSKQSIRSECDSWN